MSRRKLPKPYYSLTEIIADFKEDDGRPTTHYMVQHDETGS